ncbi:hypothetical protein GCK72_009456 [Caenorhabditis remanei]|uniref:Uncharacterized protein n=2 Tax=Caenorhabditis remanei TaxID=31234 RepID=E3LSD3_CAERE|nr:hypothetical protein GCK72_009456 [Caenorhabditis remanei]EFP09115.1 hypothetical protein CRE_25572 [Caenorhabditis remanei]KAF1761202.1 hypothetical protein GCK72_009456 [Caenorhabditis remanei]
MQYILPPDSVTMVAGAFGGIGALSTLAFVILAVLQSKSAVCKPPGKEDVDKLSSIEGLRQIKDDTGDPPSKGKSSVKEKLQKKKPKKEV